MVWGMHICYVTNYPGLTLNTSWYFFCINSLPWCSWHMSYCRPTKKSIGKPRACEKKVWRKRVLQPQSKVLRPRKINTAAEKMDGWKMILLPFEKVPRQGRSVSFGTGTWNHPKPAHSWMFLTNVIINTERRSCMRSIQASKRTPFSTRD